MSAFFLWKDNWWFFFFCLTWLFNGLDVCVSAHQLCCVAMGNRQYWTMSAVSYALYPLKTLFIIQFLLNGLKLQLLWQCRLPRSHRSGFQPMSKSLFSKQPVYNPKAKTAPMMPTRLFKWAKKNIQLRWQRRHLTLSGEKKPHLNCQDYFWKAIQRSTNSVSLSCIGPWLVWTNSLARGPSTLTKSLTTSSERKPSKYQVNLRKVVFFGYVVLRLWSHQQLFHWLTSHRPNYLPLK